MDELHKMSAILIERETIDKDQFERLLAGEPEDDVFREEPPATPEEQPKEAKKRRPAPKPRPFPLAGRSSSSPRPRRRTRANRPA